MVVALTAAAHAADYEPAPAPTFDWSGFYIGAHGGYADFDNDGFFATSVDMQFAGGDFIGGGQAGWNMQRNSWVFGVETDISFLEWTGKNVREEQYIAEADFLATLRGRVGWADDNVLFYGTAGGALLNAEVLTSIGGPDLDQQGNEGGKDVSDLGIVLGGGIEWGMTRNLSVKAEALYFFFDDFYKLVDLDEGCEPGVDGCLDVGPPNNFSIDDGFAFRLGANWRFGGDADGPGDEEALAVTAASHDWSGFYVGLHAGYGGFDTDGIYINEPDLRVTASGETVPVLLHEFDNHGLLGGVQIGFNWQVGSLLLGVEGDISGVDWNNVLPDVQVPVEPVIMALDVDFLATARARAGWVRNNMLYYVTAGAAFMESELSVRAASLAGTPTVPGTLTDPDSKDISAIAPVVGGGIEWKYTPNLSFKAEGLYLAFDEDIDLADLQGSGRPGDHIEIEDGFLFRLGANWQLWPQDSEMGLASYAAAEVTHPGPRYDWTGFYVGGHVGWGGLVTDGLFNPNWDDAQQLTANQAIDLTGVNDLGVLGGGQVGFNWQTGPLVFGVEGDIAAVDWDGTETEFIRPQDHMDFNSDYIATARARVGYADDNLLFYATAGLAYVDAELDNTGNREVVPVPTGVPGEDDLSETGGRGTKKDVSTWGGAAGLGMEWGITRNLSAKVEGLFLFFDDTTNIEDLGDESDPGDYFHLDDGFVVRVGANWRFNPFNRDLGDQSDYVGGSAALAEVESQNGAADEKPGMGEDKGAEGKGEEGDKGPWKISGIINRAALIWDDGEDTEVYSVDNPQDFERRRDRRRVRAGSWLGRHDRHHLRHLLRLRRQRRSTRQERRRAGHRAFVQLCADRAPGLGHVHRRLQRHGVRRDRQHQSRRGGCGRRRLVRELRLQFLPARRRLSRKRRPDVRQGRSVQRRPGRGAVGRLHGRQVFRRERPGDPLHQPRIHGLHRFRRGRPAAGSRPHEERRVSVLRPRPWCLRRCRPALCGKLGRPVPGCRRGWRVAGHGRRRRCGREDRGRRGRRFVCSQAHSDRPQLRGQLRPREIH